MISMSEEKSLLVDVFMTRMRVKGNEFVSTSEFESDVNSAVSVIAEEVQALRAQLAEAREALKPFAETSVDENYGGGGLWWTDYASGTRFSAYTGKIMSRRQLNRDDIYKAAEVYNKLVITA